MAMFRGDWQGKIEGRKTSKEATNYEPHKMTLAWMDQARILEER